MYYKAFRSDGKTLHGRDGWPIPQDGKPGEWVEVRGYIYPCGNGLHIMTKGHLAYWPGPRLYLVDVAVDGEVVECDDKIVVSKARLVRPVDGWNARSMFLWLADCVEHVLPSYARVYPKDMRPHRAVKTIRARVRGMATAADIVSALMAADAACDHADNSSAGPEASLALYAADAASRAIRAVCAHSNRQDGDTVELVASAARMAAHAAPQPSDDARPRWPAVPMSEELRWSSVRVERRWQSERMMEYINGRG